MSKIRFIDIAGTNCWIAYNMPLSSEQRSDYDLVDYVQSKCVERKIFGMGWDVNIAGFDSSTYMTEENISRYRSEYSKQHGNVSKQAIDAYKNITKGDYVITRNKNGHFYVGKVSSEGAYYLYNGEDDVLKYFSWGCSVEGWKDFPTEQGVPSEIVGRFSQRYHATIQRIGGYRQRLLVVSMYGDLEIPKLSITKYNFVNSMNYKELEDLVAIFIANRHRAEGYSFLPSSCKTSQQNIEYYFVAGGKKPITCQVKNQKEVDIGRYLDETQFEKIYLFSGKWSDELVQRMRTRYGKYRHFYIISPEELFETLQEDLVFENPYYDYHTEYKKPEEINLDGYTKRKKPNGDLEYSIDEDFICFVNKDGLFYSREFGSLILSYHILPEKERDRERQCIKRIMDDINRD